MKTKNWDSLLNEKSSSPNASSNLVCIEVCDAKNQNWIAQDKRQMTHTCEGPITDLEEVLKLGWTLLIAALCVEQNVGLGFQHSLLTDQSDRAVVEVVPSVLVKPVCRVMS